MLPPLFEWCARLLILGAASWAVSRCCCRCSLPVLGLLMVAMTTVSCCFYFCCCGGRTHPIPVREGRHVREQQDIRGERKRHRRDKGSQGGDGGSSPSSPSPSPSLPPLPFISSSPLPHAQFFSLVYLFPVFGAENDPPARRAAWTTIARNQCDMTKGPPLASPPSSQPFVPTLVRRTAHRLEEPVVRCSSNSTAWRPSR